MIEPSRWKEISRRSLTLQEVKEIVDGTTITSGKSFDIAIVTKVKEKVQIVYERIPYTGGNQENDEE